MTKMISLSLFLAASVIAAARGAALQDAAKSEIAARQICAAGAGIGTCLPNLWVCDWGGLPPTGECASMTTGFKASWTKDNKDFVSGRGWKDWGWWQNY
jgi:hypothetical protein